MEIINVQQGTPEWLAIRARHYTGSEAAAMLGLSTYMTRADLLKQKATGIVPEVSAGQQRMFDRGHEAEEKTRPAIEAELGEDLYPATCRAEIDGLPLLASLDGLTMDESTTWEAKLWNEALAQAVMGNEVPDTHWPQVEQGLLVTGAQRCRFTVSDGEDRKVSCWYESVPERRALLIAGWRQFHADLANYQHVETVAEPVAAPIEALPALFVQLEGRVVSSNLEAFKASALTFIRGINTDLQTDQHFADADQMVKFCKDGEDRLETVKAQALAQTASIDELFRTIDTISAELRAKRLELDRLVKARKESIRGEIVQGGAKALAEHIAALNTRLGKPYMPTIQADFAGAIKGKRTIASLQDAVDTTLANAKIEASAIADRIEINLKYLRENAADYAFLFADTAQICLKANDDFAILARSRIDGHKAEMEAKRLRDEEAAKKVVEQTAQQPAPVQAVASVPPAPAVQQVAKPSAAPTLKLGMIADRLGFALTAAQMSALGFEPAGKDKAAVLYRESDWPLICDAISARAQEAKLKVAA